jgi:polyphosphate kinase
MMHRNLDRRVEVLARVADPKLTKDLDAVLDLALDPATRCWVLDADGEWTPSPHEHEQVRDYQVELMRWYGAKG